MASARDIKRPASDSADPEISHFIPSVELTGSREDKLRKLDILIVYLHQLRGRLVGDLTVRPANMTRVSQWAWQWFAVGLVVGAVCVLLLMTARRWGL